MTFVVVHLCRQRPPTPSDDCLTWLSSSKWSTIISSRWKRPEHINSLELRAVLTAVRWSLSHSSARGKKLLILCDSLVTIGCVNKGRSSSFRLLAPLRAIAAAVLASGSRVYLNWIPTHHNPSDHASRPQQRTYVF